MFRVFDETKPHGWLTATGKGTRSLDRAAQYLTREDAQAAADAIPGHKRVRIMEFDSVHIIGRRWFRRSYGNTYSSCEIWHKGEMIGRRVERGYEDYYLQMALQLMIAHGLAPEHFRGRSASLVLRDSLGATWEVHDVARERDL